jgi:TorA maturation chaperone TorD
MAGAPDGPALDRAFAHSYRLLARLFGREVEGGIEMLTVALSTAAFGASASTSPAVDSDLDDLATEYCRLFVGPSPCCAPYASTRLGGTMMRGRTADKVRVFAEQAGLELRVDPSLVSEDHVAVLFDVLAELYDRRAEGLSREDELAQFLRELVHPWVPDFLASVKEATSCELYRAAAQLALALLTSSELADGTTASA